MARVAVETEVEIDIAEHLDELETFELIDELESRNEYNQVKEFTGEHIIVLENLYYALRDGTKEDAIRIINPLLDEKLGRKV